MAKRPMSENDPFFRSLPTSNRWREGTSDAVIHTVIVFALWRIFFGFSSGGLSMWRFE